MIHWLMTPITQLNRYASSGSVASDINPFGLVTADGLTTLFGRNSRRSESSEPINWQLIDTLLLKLCQLARQDRASTKVLTVCWLEKRFVVLG